MTKSRCSWPKDDPVYLEYHDKEWGVPVYDDLELFENEPKGELTVVISEKKIDKKASQKLSESDMSVIRKMINKLSVKEITDFINQNRDVPKKEIYNYCLKLKNEI